MRKGAANTGRQRRLTGADPCARRRRLRYRPETAAGPRRGSRRDGVATSLINNERARGLFYQALVIGALAALIGAGWRNAVVNMEARGIPTGFGFWDETAGFAINQSLVDYSALSTYGRAFWVGLLNTLLVGALSIALATPLGFAIGVFRLSPNWILAKIALGYVELMRNTPLLLQLLFWYNAVLKSLPGPRQSLDLGGLVLLNNRGLFLPRPVLGEGAWTIAAALGVGIAGALAYAHRARRRQ